MDILNKIFMLVNICCFGGAVFSLFRYLSVMAKDRENIVRRRKYAYMFVAFVTGLAGAVIIGCAMNIARYS